MTEDEISKIKEHIEIHARRESHAVKITAILRKAVDELEHIADLKKENEELKGQVEMSYEVYNDNLDYSHHIEEQLTKAKEIIEELYNIIPASMSDYAKEPMEHARKFMTEEADE